MLMNPFFSRRNDFERLRREMNQLFSDVPFDVHRAPAYPAVNVWTNTEGVIVTAELPGCAPEALDISVVGDVLTLAGQREAESCEEGGTYHRRERGCGNFKRTFQLPFDIEAETVDATFAHGVLHLTLPRAEASKPKKINIRTI